MHQVKELLQAALGWGAFAAGAAMIAGCGGGGPSSKTVTAAPSPAPIVLEAARPLPLSAVRLTGGPLKHAQDLDARYLLELEPDRMMAGYRARAGLEPKAEGYGGWDAVQSRQLTGHIAGHYLSAVSLLYAATGDARFKDRADYLVREMKEVQDRHGDGYLGAVLGTQGSQRGGGPNADANSAGAQAQIPGVVLDKDGQPLRDNRGNVLIHGKELFNQLSRGVIRSGGFDLNGMWSPWYTLHKTYAGLRDAYRYTGNRTALEVEVRFAEWAQRILSPLTDTQIQQMLNTEFGGMNEVFVDLYADTGDPRWLDLSYTFEHRRFTEPLQRHQNRLAGQHANTAIPKVIGSADRFVCTGRGADLMAAGFFWDEVVQHHTFATGGHGQVENFPVRDQLSRAIDQAANQRTAESCNVYNMLKLTRRLFALHPDPHYADFQERALFNHVLASMDPNDGRTSYMVPVGQGVRQEVQDLFEDFTCCVGSGMESHALHGDGIYYESGDTLFVNLYAPSTAEWASRGVRLEVATDLPEGDSARLTLTLHAPRSLTLALRRPFWAGSGFAVRINGEVQADPSPPVAQGGPGARGAGAAGARGGRGRGQGRAQAAPPVSSYLKLTRIWKTGDTVELTLPKSLRLEPTPDDPNRVAILYGPLVLAGDLGEVGAGGTRRGGGARPSVPVFVAAGRPVEEWLRPVQGQVCTFRTEDVGRMAADPQAPRDVTFRPFFRTHRTTYGVYWDLARPDRWQAQVGTVTPEERRQRLDAATVGVVQPGEMQAERDANYRSSMDRPVLNLDGRSGRGGQGWFSLDLPVDPAHPMALLVTYHTAQPGTAFDVLVDGSKVGQQHAAGSGGFYDVEYTIPTDLVRDRQKVTVRFQARDGEDIAAVCGVRMIRADAQR